ncbi:hypothetical protein [Actinoplanes sp. NPDC051859]|uniref:hypothetical protein n=1 Tax=Actinoplanes sp. NPDC051859 TaxID=3363909 RepID=UPI0037B2CDCB
MKLRRLSVASLALVAVVGVSACDRPAAEEKTAAGAAATTAAPADATAELTAAMKKLGDQPVKMTMDMGTLMNATGAVDAKGKKADITMKMAAGGQSIDMKMRLVDKDLYLKFEGAAAAATGGADTWLHVDAAKIPAGSQLDVENLASADKFVGGMEKVEKAGAGDFKGLLDMTKVPGQDTSAFGTKAKAVPFTAKVDDQGRLTELVLDMSTLGLPAEAPTKITTKYHDFGSPVSVQAPASDKVQEMPAEMLKSFT